MRQIKSKVIYNRRLSPLYYKLGLTCKEIPQLAVPGQFVMVSVNSQFDPLFSRPFCVYKVLKESEEIEVVYKVVGKGTSILQEKVEGDELEILGPLGNGYSLDDGEDDFIFVAGGIGIAAFYFLAEKIRESRGDSGVTLFFGGKSKEDIICLEDFNDLKVEIIIATEDGSLGTKGLITDLLKKNLHEKKRSKPRLFACGPEAMLREVAFITEKKGMSCQVSLEKEMACGFGICLGCVVKQCKNVEGDKELRWKYARVCKEGPVFDSREILWD
jgi:dihydroorotate dehydrogenase electron transfer subunit